MSTVRKSQVVSTCVSSVHCKRTACLGKCTSAPGVDLYKEADRSMLGTVLQLFNSYHLLRHIPLLLISNPISSGLLEHLEGGEGQLADMELGLSLSLHCGYCQQGSIHA